MRLPEEPVVIQVSEGHGLSHPKCKKRALAFTLTAETKRQWGKDLSGAGGYDWMCLHANRVVK